MERGDNKIENIKFIYIFNKIVSFLNDSCIMEIIKYNLNVQKKLGIDISHYRKRSGKYKNGSKNGIAEEYTLDKRVLLFKGQYLNGKKNGHEKNIIIRLIVI